METSHFNALFDACRERGYEVVIEEHDRSLFLVISHREHGPLVMWATFNGSLEETARYALLPFREARNQKNP